MVEKLLKSDREKHLNEIIEHTQIVYIANAGNGGKKGYQAYRSFINSLTEKQFYEKNNSEQPTIWQKIKRIKDKAKNGV